MLYPIFTDLTDRRVAVIGGGPVAQRKVERLLECGARVVLISPEITEKLAELARQGQIDLRQRAYRPGDLAGAWLVIAASADQQVNRKVYDEARQHRIFCNVVDVPELCSFQVPSVVQRDQLQIAVSTGGVSPALAQLIRQQLEENFDNSYEDFLTALRDLREHVKNKYPENQPLRAQILEGFVRSDAKALLQQGKKEQFWQLLDRWKNR